MKKVVDFANKILLITNLWVILYTFIIDYLNYKFPPTIQGTYYRLEGIFPEPNEIPIYLGLTILFISSIIFFYNKINDIYEVLTATNVRKYGLFLFLLVLFITKLGSFPLAGDLTPYSASHDQSFYIIIWLLFVSCIAFLSLELVFIKKFLKNIAKQDFLIYLLVVIFIAFVTFQARFPITTINYAQFYGPVSEVASGKTIFTDIPAGTGIFGSAQSFRVGDPLFRVVTENQTLEPWPDGVGPALGDSLVVVAQAPPTTNWKIEIDNAYNGQVRFYQGKEKPRVIARVFSPVTGSGRFSGTIFQGLGRIRANHPGVICVSTCPVGEEGGFQIVPCFHTNSSNLTYVKRTPVYLVIGPVSTLDQPLEGQYPLYFDTLRPGDRVDAKVNGVWGPMPVSSGKNLTGLSQIQAIRITPGE